MFLFCATAIIFSGVYEDTGVLCTVIEKCSINIQIWDANIL